MNVALAFPGCHRRGGVERVMFECARYLACAGHNVTVAANEWEPDVKSAIRYHHIPVRSQPWFLKGASYFQQCTRELRNVRHDVLNTHGCVCPTGGVHWVQSLHRAWLDRSREIRKPLSLARIRQRLNPLHPVLLRYEAEHFAGRMYRKIIATTDRVRQDLQHYYDVPARDVVVIPNGFAPTEFNPQERALRRSAVRERLSLRPDEVVLLLVANELERKGYTTILGAMARLRRPELRLIVVGRPATHLVMREAARFGVAGQVLACGSASDVAEYHAAADVFVLPTQYEAFCLAILEALGSGLPVITSNVPGAADAIQPGVNGYTIENPKSSEELSRVLERVMDPLTRQTLSDNAPATVERFQWPAVLERYERVLLDHCN